MSNEVVLSSTINAVGLTIAALIKSFRASNLVQKSDLETLRERLAEAKALARLQANGSLIRANVDELINTQRKIDNGGLHGKALELALEQMYLLAQLNTRAIEGFGRG
ncbi:hypothetical protein [Agromyces sp. Leaf222]|uniref:hypothetical protein n=1 Tax=Agromyces sp. Leaf222 TaxID=1735688 RepID=UPI000AB5964A|nr:hypothetical protein [Agromyces sp. Leaf222]